MSLAEYIKIPTDFFEAEPIKSIFDKGPVTDDTVLLYLHLLCEANQENRRSLFTIGNIILTEDVLSCVFPYANLDKKLETLEMFGLIKRNERSIQVFKSWDDPHDRTSQKYREWRTTVFVRDGYRCKKCGAKRNLQAHHIKTWHRSKELRYEVSNGVTLCRKCHLEAHGGCWRNGE